MTKLIKIFYLAASFLTFCGCGMLPPIPQKFYDGPDLSLDQVASIAFGGGFGINIQSIDGKPAVVNAPGGAHRPTKGLHVLPGPHTIIIGQTNFIGSSLAGPEMTATFASSKKEITLQAEAGHSYVPRAKIKDNSVIFWFEDKGKNYPQECMTESAYAKAYSEGKPLQGC